MSQPAHTKLLNQAARQILRPLGLKQKGTSRVWLDDRSWWLIHVEFQPSAYSKGSFLNVGAMWLWLVKDYYSFDFGSRIEGFIPFENEAQFEQVAVNLANRAAEEVERYRSLFQSVHDAARQLAEKTPFEFWDAFHAGVAFGLIGDTLQAVSFFSKVIATDDSPQFAKDAAMLARDLSLLCHDRDGFRKRIESDIGRTREVLKLPVVEVKLQIQEVM